MEERIAARKRRRTIVHDIVDLIAKHKLSVYQAKAALDDAKTAVENYAIVVPVNDD